MTKNEQIKQTLKETHERRKTQIIKVFELKVNCHHTSKETFKKLNDMFKQAKWLINDVIGSKENIFKYDYKEHRKLFGSTKRTEWLEQPSVETNTSTLSSVSRLTLQALSVKQEKEATSL